MTGMIFSSAVVLLSLLSGAADAAKCDTLYTAAYPAADAAPLDCQPFGGDPMLHAIVHGCNPVNQNEEVPAGYSSQTFTQKCEATVAEETTWTCYELAADTDFSTFTGSVDSNLACATGDKVATPSFLYQQSTGEFEFGGGQGSQSTEVPVVVTEFDPAQASEAYYAVLIEEGEPPLTESPADPATTAPEAAVDPATEPASGAPADEPIPAPETGTEPAGDEPATEPPTEPSEASSDDKVADDGSAAAPMVGWGVGVLGMVVMTF